MTDEDILKAEELLEEQTTFNNDGLEELGGDSENVICNTN